LHGGPLAFLDAAVEADMPPPGPADEDGNEEDRPDVLILELRPLLLGELADVPLERGAVRHDVDPAPQSRLDPRLVLHRSVVDLGRYAGRAPFEELGRREGP